MTAAITLTDVTKSFGTQLVLDGISLEVPAGSVYALLGSNGAGKTTTISILTTLLQADSGAATVAGHDVATEPAAVRRAISMTGQNVTVDPVLTGLENLVLIGRLRHVADPKRVAADLIERFGLASAAAKPTATYSGGMKRRLDIAMSLIGEPEVVFLDEPTTGLDPAGRREVWDTITGLAATGTTIMLTTQYMEEAAHLADTIAVLAGGRITASGTHDDILEVAGAADLESAFLALTAEGARS
ncbi:MAG TPA: ABC transporter ATP-binding protein [Ornithinibacter sp.]|nr:ABC transporter ATP-binding protein [Ornithinibacter sp.]